MATGRTPVTTKFIDKPARSFQVKLIFLLPVGHFIPMKYGRGGVVNLGIIYPNFGYNILIMASTTEFFLHREKGIFWHFKQDQCKHSKIHPGKNKPGIKGENNVVIGNEIGFIMFTMFDLLPLTLKINRCCHLIIRSMCTEFDCTCLSWNGSVCMFQGLKPGVGNRCTPMHTWAR